MALSSANLTAEPRAFSIGPKKIQIKTFTVASGDTSGTVTFDGLARLDAAIVTGLVQTAQPTVATNVATLAFADPVATVMGQIIGIGI